MHPTVSMKFKFCNLDKTDLFHCSYFDMKQKGKQGCYQGSIQVKQSQGGTRPWLVGLSLVTPVFTLLFQINMASVKKTCCFFLEVRHSSSA